MNRTSYISITLLALAAVAGIVAAQRTSPDIVTDPSTASPTPAPAAGGSRSLGNGGFIDPRASSGFIPTSPRRGSFSGRTGRLQSSWPPKPTDLSDRHGIVVWDTDPNFKKDMFTFCRIEYHSYRYSDSWLTDFPDSDLDFSFRLQQLTSMKVNPMPVRVKITDKELFDYPFLYMLEVATLEFLDEEIEPLRRHLTNGGFLMVDDFWGERAWLSFKDQMKRILPDCEPVELDITHPLFHCVFDLKQLPQIPGIEQAVKLNTKVTGITTEVALTGGTDGDGKPHFYAYFDKKGRMMAIVCNNNDLGDSWEREGEDQWYFETFSVKQGYPMGVNIVFWAMTH